MGIKQCEICPHFSPIGSVVTKRSNISEILNKTVEHIWLAGPVFPELRTFLATQLWDSSGESPPLKNGGDKWGILSTRRAAPLSKVFQRLGLRPNLKKLLRPVASRPLNFTREWKEWNMDLFFWRNSRLSRPHLETEQNDGNIRHHLVKSSDASSICASHLVRSVCPSPGTPCSLGAHETLAGKFVESSVSSADCDEMCRAGALLHESVGAAKLWKSTSCHIQDGGRPQLRRRPVEIAITRAADSLISLNLMCVGALWARRDRAVIEIHLSLNARRESAPNFQSSNRHNSPADWSISLTFCMRVQYQCALCRGGTVIEIHLPYGSRCFLAICRRSVCRLSVCL